MIIRYTNQYEGRVNEITALLHQSYAPLAAQGMRYLASHQSSEKTVERLKEGESYLYMLDEKIVGTITLRPHQTNNPCEWYNKENIFSFGQFAVNPELQGHGIGSKMMDFIEARAAELGAIEIALDTSEHAHHLINMYKKRNYRFVQNVQWSVTNYLSVVMSKAL